MDDLSGRIVKSYQITNQINSGGFGAVYHAFQPVIDREVALKVILPRYANETEFIRRFEVEAQTVAQLEHPYIVPLYDYWRDPDGAYLVMRLMRGGNLRDVVQRGALSLDTVREYVDQIAAALGLAHRQNIIHRDIKPENMLLDEEGNVFLTDFGIAQRNDISLNTADEDSIAGSVNYIAPEIIRSERSTVTSDIYSLSIMIYELLVGALPFQGTVAPQILHAHLISDFPDITDIAPHIPESVSLVLQRAAAKDPEDRYPSAREFASAFRNATAREGTLNVDKYMTNEMFTIVDNPYKGLRAFTESDAVDFFGREQLIGTLIERLNADETAANFLAVVGPSGSGKSSVVRAGLIPRMREGDVGNSANWFVAEMVPGEDPIGNLSNALISLSSDPLPDLRPKLEMDENAIIWATNKILQDTPDGYLLIFIDQFEEVFTQTENDEALVHLLKMLNRTVQRSSNIYLIVTIRADFFDKPLLYEGIGDLMQTRTQVVLPLNAREIERTITGPAENANLVVERELVAAIVGDVRHEPGALPLLQYTLTELFERRKTNRLTLDSYIDSGGVLSSLARRAQEVYDDLLVDQRQLTRQVFLRLVTLGEGTEDTRRRARRSELLKIGDDRDAVIKILDEFGKYRLLTFDRDSTTREPTVEIAHEALIKRWDDLQLWLDQSRNDVRLQRSLANAAQEWRDSNEQLGYLLYGARLLQYEEWVAETSVAINEQERAFLNASIAEKERREQEERERQEYEALLQTRVLNRTRFLAVVMAGAVLITVALAVVAIGQRRAAQTESANAQRAQATSDANAFEAQARAREVQNFNLVNVAQSAIDDGDNSLAVALLNAVAQSSDLSPAIESGFYETAYATQLRSRISAHTDKVTAIAISSDGSLIATGAEDSQIILWNASTQQAITTFIGHRGIISDLAFSPDNTRLVSVGNDAQVILWDIRQEAMLYAERAHTNVITGVSYAPDGTQFATSSNDDTVIIWDANSGDPIMTLTEHTDSVRDVAYSPTGRQLATASRDATIILWDVASGLPSQTLIGHDAEVTTVDFSASGTRLLSGSFDRSLIIWDVATGNSITPLLGHSFEITSASFSPDDTFIVSTSCAERDAERACIRGEVILWDALNGREIREYVGHTEIVNVGKFTPNGEQIITGSCSIRRQGGCIAGEALIWDVAASSDMFQRLDGHRSSVFSVDYDAQRGRVLSGGGSLLLDDQPQGDTSIILWDTATRNVIERYEGHTANVTELIFHPNGNQFLSSSRDGTVRIWSLSREEMPDVFSEHRGTIYDVEITSDGQRILSAGDNRVLFWNFSSQTIVLTLENFGNQISARSLAISPDDTIIATGLNNGVIILWDAETGEEINRLTGHTDDILSLDFTADGTQLVSGSNDLSVRLWDVASARQLNAYSGHDAPVTDVSILKDGQYILSASEDSTLIYWDATSNEIIRQMRGHTGSIIDVSVSQDGNIAYTASTDGSVMGWRISIGSVIEWLTENRIQRDLTPDELESFQITVED